MSFPDPEPKERYFAPMTEIVKFAYNPVDDLENQTYRINLATPRMDTDDAITFIRVQRDE